VFTGFMSLCIYRLRPDHHNITLAFLWLAI